MELILISTTEAEVVNGEIKLESIPMHHLEEEHIGFGICSPQRFCHNVPLDLRCQDNYKLAFNSTL